MDDTRKRIVKCYSGLNLDFLEEEDSTDNAPIANMLALKARAVGVKEAANALPASIISSPFLLYISSTHFTEMDIFVEPLGSFFSNVNEILLAFSFLIKCHDSACMNINIFGAMLDNKYCENSPTFGKGMKSLLLLCRGLCIASVNQVDDLRS